MNDLLAAQIVTADGELLYVDAETHPDLFWAIRGGGGNFGCYPVQVPATRGGHDRWRMLIIPATSEGHLLVRRRSGGRSRRTLDHRQRNGGASDAVLAP